MNEIKSKLEKRGRFFCPAKWQELYLYLNHGNTNSCSHPIPHKIPPKELKENLFALHNTEHKMKVQQQMLNNEIPSECHMCWHLEDKGIDSDRFVRSRHWESSIDSLEVNEKHVPKFIEVVFDNLCNLSCSYCDSGQSSKWTNILQKTGSWDIETDSRNLYNKIHIKSGFVHKIYIDAWNKWWPLIKNEVEILKISGGEPLISPNFWDTVCKIDDNNLNLNLSINSNMCIDKKYIDKLLNISKNYKTVRISASIDATNEIAEYTRNGLDYKLFLENVNYWCENSPDNCFLNLQSTVNIFNIWGITDKFDLHLKLKEKYGLKIKECYSTIVRFPEFQNFLLLPYDIKKSIHDKMSIWYDNNHHKFSDKENIFIKKTFQNLLSESDEHNLEMKKLYKKDLIKFIKNYDKFNKHKFENVYPIEFINWINQA